MNSLSKKMIAFSAFFAIILLLASCSKSDNSLSPENQSNQVGLKDYYTTTLTDFEKSEVIQLVESALKEGTKEENDKVFEERYNSLKPNQLRFFHGEIIRQTASGANENEIKAAISNFDKILIKSETNFNKPLNKLSGQEKKSVFDSIESANISERACTSAAYGSLLAYQVGFTSPHNSCLLVSQVTATGQSDCDYELKFPTNQSYAYVSVTGSTSWSRSLLNQFCYGCIMARQPSGSNVYVLLGKTRCLLYYPVNTASNLKSVIKIKP
jgi:hypothetical protein